MTTSLVTLPPFDWRNPDYESIYRQRASYLQQLRNGPPELLAGVRAHYAEHPVEFIQHWGFTTDPRSIAKGRPALVPFVLFPRQVEMLEWMVERWRKGEPGTIVKSRDVGASFCAMALLAALCIFTRNFAAGVASATEVKLDRSGDPDTLFFKLRSFVQNLPPEFQGGYDRDKTDNYLRVAFPETGSSVTGEAGNQAGRGGRKSLYVVDESAWMPNPRAIDASLAATTDCRLDMSSVNGIGNPFYERSHNPHIPRFDFTWRDDPRKDQAWYDAQCAKLDSIVVAQEIDCSFTASVEGVVIPSAWIQAAIGLHERLKIPVTGRRYAALDLGDVSDRSALAVRHGFYLEHVESWSGAGSDLMRTTAKAFRLCDERNINDLLFDCDGIGASVKGDARTLNEQREQAERPKVKVEEYRGSSAPLWPKQVAPRTNVRWEDYVANRKAQSWIHLRSLFEQAYRASKDEPFDKEHFISINPKIRELSRLIAELSQPTMSETATGKILIDKLGDGERSPDVADAVCMVMAPRNVPMKISDSVFSTLEGFLT